MTGNEEIWLKLQEMDNKLDNIQGDTNVQSQVLKESSKELLQKTFKMKFGRSENRMKMWYHADGPKTAEELEEATGLSMSQVRNKTSEMTELALLSKKENGDRTVYYRNETTEGIGLEDHVEDFVDDL